MKNFYKTSLGRTASISIASAVAYGGVAYYLNREFSQSVAIDAAITQALVCGLATLISSNLMEFFYRFYHKQKFQKLLTTLSSASIMLSFSFLAHWVNGTPNMLITIASAAALALPYYCFYPIIIDRTVHEKA